MHYYLMAYLCCGFANTELATLWEKESARKLGVMDVDGYKERLRTQHITHKKTKKTVHNTKCTSHRVQYCCVP